MHRLFVYGTLGPDGPNAHVLAPLGGEWQAATVRGHLEAKGWGADLGYPGLRLDDDGPAVEGHVLTAPALADRWAWLDDFEGPEYDRVPVIATTQDGQSLDAFTYVLRGN